MKELLLKYKPSAHVVAVCVLAVLAAYNSNQQFHDAVVHSWSSLPILVRVPVEALIPLAMQYWNSQKGEQK